MFIKSPATRAYIYGILVAVGAIALVYGLVTEEQLAVWLGLGGSILGNGLALANTNKGAHEA
ncbi:holin [Arthrobacter phage Nellie]|uniref:Holin n=4 Tax=Jasminevirus adat TaxID=2560299 RepID=A0A249XN67_9CAUD|nr:holin [Arthrobacter phage Adat]ASZ73183.1 holin [Arthrobacter phage GurgleFerb]ASZ73747.1 holin [Arthrobacter phage Nellie]AXH43717.1 holin [Arthrobacter phage Brad]USL89111.1 holin [Arthrobacter phage Casserole]ASZ72601.1 holin [Arthrobacter phage Adat]